MSEFDPRTPAEETLSQDLEAAAAWFFAKCDPDPEAATSTNRFLHLADHAYYAQLREYLATRPPDNPLPTTGVWLYRLYDKSDRLLYVGISANFSARIQRHKRLFGDLLDHWKLESFQDRADALAAESKAIATEYPAFNVVDPEPK